MSAVKPLCIDLYAGLGGWAEGFLAEGYDVVGFDIEKHQYWVPQMNPKSDGSKNTKPVEKRGWTQGCAVSFGMEGESQKPRTELMSYPGQLVLQDVLTLDGSQFKDATVIVASPPCQAYSYMAMPWSRAKAKRAAILADQSGEERRKLNTLFDACFRIQREASEAAGRHIPMVVENVRGAQEWVGRAKAHYGSYYLWGDVPALMPIKVNTVGHVNRGDGHAQRENDAVKGMSGLHGLSHPDGKYKRDLGGLNDPRRFSSKSSSRKAASALIAKIPFALARHIARTYWPHGHNNAVHIKERIMSKRKDPVVGITEWFETAPLPEAEVVIKVVSAMVKRRRETGGSGTWNGSTFTKARPEAAQGARAASGERGAPRGRTGHDDGAGLARHPRGCDAEHEAATDRPAQG